MAKKTVLSIVNDIRARGQRKTLLGIGPVSENVIRAAFRSAARHKYPPMFIASRNQIDADEFGGGYVRGWDQKRCLEHMSEAAAKENFDGPFYMCRDHGGPWQRDEEYQKKLPLEEALSLCIQSFKVDIDNGFDLLHVDPTKNPHQSGQSDMVDILNLTIEIILELEAYRKGRGCPEISYEIGTEETDGGLTSIGAFEDFIRKYMVEAEARGLPKPAFVVGQTGTLTRLIANVGDFDKTAAEKLSSVCDTYGTGLKEHNCDYLPEALLSLHTGLGIHAANVAPEFGAVESTSYLNLAAIEARLSAQRGFTASKTAKVLIKNAIDSGKWQKWLTADQADLGDKIDGENAILITKISGHYTLESADFIAERAKMYENLAGASIDGAEYVIESVRASIDRYVRNFNLYHTL